MNQVLTCSIVLFKNDPDEIAHAIASTQACMPSVTIHLVDNSPTDELSILAKQFGCIYTHEGDNIGFGAGHNVAIYKALENNAKYHLVLNPDIYFDKTVLPALIQFLDENHQIGFVMPKILYPNGDIQYLCKLLPTPVDLILRRFFPGLYKKLGLLRRYELHDSGYNRIMKVPYLSGCFMLMRCDVLRQVGAFDEKFFMYLEDVDLCRRIGKVSETIFFPEVSVFHKYGKGSYNNMKLLSYHIRSAIYYFFKWGWFFDPERKLVNRNVLMDLNKYLAKKNRRHD